jgi:hypothetical protein
MSLPIKYDADIHLSAVSEDPLSFLPLERVINNLSIITDYDNRWLHDLPLNIKTIALTRGTLKKDTDANSILRSKKFAEHAKNSPKTRYLLYAPLNPPYRVNPLYFLMNSPTIAHAYENKRYFRDEFEDLIRVPEYSLHLVDDLDKKTYSDLYDEFDDFILQDEVSQGSKGTYPVHNYRQYQEAVTALKKYSRSRGVVASRFIHGYPAGVQACITKYGIFHSGIQRQILDNKYLCNVKLEGVTKFCGGEVGGKYSDIVNHQVQEIVSVVGSRLASHGYKGIFGIDLIITPSGVVYAIEINGRLTAFSHIIADNQIMHGRIPFMLLHVLELGNYDYKITDLSAIPQSDYSDQVISYLIINNAKDGDLTLKHYIRPGIYSYTDSKIEFLRPGVSIQDLKSSKEVLIFSKFDEGAVISRGKRILKITHKGKALEKGEFSKSSQRLVGLVKKKFELK